ncbi:hypothetical protein [Bowmanella denitrificans]|uniref:hypothetical protein n=1 Tax=Bowmanella denitrificans TaxID=366582 RepID=UPI0011AFA9A7|nr:hypothetical protein [Bowmanella denitrificans]
MKSNQDNRNLFIAAFILLGLLAFAICIWLTVVYRKEFAKSSFDNGYNSLISIYYSTAGSDYRADAEHLVPRVIDCFNAKAAIPTRGPTFKHPVNPKKVRNAQVRMCVHNAYTRMRAEDKDEFSGLFNQFRVPVPANEWKKLKMYDSSYRV